MMHMIFLIGILLAGGAAMMLIAPHDISLSIWLCEHKARWLVKLMSE